MTDVAAMIEKARNAAGAIGADLAGFGGVLRCSRCSAEQPLGEVGHHIGHGWPECCGLTMTWVTARTLAWEARQPVPEGYHLEAVPKNSLRFGGRWEPDATRRCRHLAAARAKACGKPSAAVLWRAYRGRGPRPWGYCPDHMYGNWVESGQVMCWILKADADE